MELHFKYLDAMQVADKKIEGEKHDMVRRGEIIDNDTEDEFYLRRLDAGLFVLQHICYIMAEICNANVPQIRQRVSPDPQHARELHQNRQAHHQGVRGEHWGRPEPGVPGERAKRILGLLENF